MTDSKDNIENFLGTDLDELIEMEYFLYVFDRMPKKMRMVVNLRMTGYKIVEIARLLKIHDDTVRMHLRLAKKRIMRANGYL